MRLKLLTTLLLTTLTSPTFAEMYSDNNYGEAFEYYDQSEEVPVSRSVKFVSGSYVGRCLFTCQLTKSRKLISKKVVTHV